MPADRRRSLQLRVAVLRLLLARQRSDLPAVVEEAQRLLAPAEPSDTPQLGLSEDGRALALINLGIAELWTGRLDEALGTHRRAETVERARALGLLAPSSRQR